MFAWAPGSDGSPIRIAHIGFSYPGRRQLWRIEQAVPSCLGDGERLVAFLPGPARLVKDDVLGRRASDAVVVTTRRLLLLRVRDGDLLLVDDVPLGDVEVLENGDRKSPVKLKVRGQQMWVLVNPKYAGGTGSVRKAAVLAARARSGAGEPPIEAALRGEDFHLVLRIDGYEHDGWLFATVSVKLPDGKEHTMDCEPCIRSVELERFVHTLKGLVRDKSGTAELAPIEYDVDWTIKLSDGKATISGWVTELEFHDIPTDVTRIQEALEQFAALAAAFPTVGPKH